MNKCIKAALLFLLLGGFCVPAITVAQDAQEQEEATAPDNGERSSEQELSKEEAEEAASSVGRSSPNTFVPSEEISEDLSVSFPVDI